MANFGMVGLDWQERVNWDRLRNYRLDRARERMKAAGLGAMLCMYDENVRYLTGTLTPGWNRLKPGLRYALLCGDDPPVLFEQGDIGAHIARHSPWIPKENVKWSYAWIKGAAGAASLQQVTKFTNAIVKEMKKSGVSGMKLGVDFVDINIIQVFKDSKIDWADGMTPMMEARAVKNVDEQECMRMVGAIGDAAHWECMKFLKPGLTENNATALKWLYDSIKAVKVGTTTREIAMQWPSAKEAWGYEEEDQAAANLWGHGLGLAQYDPPVISRIWSLDHPVEIKEGMVFALETQHGKTHQWGVRIEEMLIVHKDRIEIISNFPVEQITVVDPMPGYSSYGKT